MQGELFAFPWAVLDAPLDNCAKNLCMYLWSIADEDGWCSPTARQIAASLGPFACRDVNYLISKLESQGMVEVPKWSGPRGGKPANRLRLIVTEPPWAWQGGSPDTSWSAARALPGQEG